MVPEGVQIMAINFKKIWEKKEELELALVENNSDVVIGSRYPCIHDSEFLPLNYTCFQRNRKDDWGGVIIIIKYKLIADQIASSMLSEIVAVKIMSNLKQLTTELQDLLLQYKNL